MWSSIEQAASGFLGIFGSPGLLPHGACFLWQEELLWTHVVADGVIATAYFSIPFVIYRIARTRKDWGFKPLLSCFSLFILLCGISHVMSIIVNWVPYYGIEAVIKAATAIASLATALLLWPLLPKIRTLPSPALLRSVNHSLEQEVAQRRTAEADLRALNDTLEARVIERTRLLREANRKLEEEVQRHARTEADCAKANDAAHAADRAKTAFLATMGHEIRTPLNAMIGIAQAIALETNSRTVREKCAIIEQSGQTLQNILQDLLSYAKIEAGHIRIEPKLFLLEDFVSQQAALWQVQAEAKGLTIITERNYPNDVQVRADPLRLSQVVSNLLSNAVKFSRQGEIRLIVTLEQRSASPQQSGSLPLADLKPRTAPETCNSKAAFPLEGFTASAPCPGSLTRRNDMDAPSTGSASLAITVRDQGIGIEPHLLPMLFQPFVQLTQERSCQFGGTGLGLALSRRLMLLMNGTLSVESVHGLGSAFTLKAPVTVAGEHAARKDVQTCEDGKVPIPRLRVLSVDDNPTNQMVMNVLLKALGQDVVLAGSGEDAIRLLQQERFDLVLLDLRMPRVDGFDVIAVVQTGQTLNTETPIYAVSANSRMEINRDLTSAGFAGYVGKPVDIERLGLVLAAGMRSRVA